MAEKDKIVSIIQQLNFLGLDYFCITSNKQDLGVFSNLSVKELTKLLYALCSQSEEIKTTVQAVFYQLQKDKDMGAPFFTTSLKDKN